MRRGLPANGATPRDVKLRRAASPRPSSARWWHHALLWIAMLASLPLLSLNLSAGGARNYEAVASAFVGFLGLGMSYRLALRFAAPGAALLATIAIWLASCLPIYLYLMPSAMELAAMFVTALFLTLSLSLREGRNSRARWIVWAIAAVAIAGAGVWMTGGHRPAMNWAHPPLAEASFSTGHGVFVWTPVILVAAVGLVFAIRRQPVVGSALAVTAVLFFYLAAAYGGPTEPSFGGRPLIPLTPILLCGLSAFVDTLVGNRGRIAWTGALTVLLALVLWNAGLMFQWKTGLVSDRATMNVRGVAANQVSAVRNAARGLVIRYVNDWKRLRG